MPKALYGFFGVPHTDIYSRVQLILQLEARLRRVEQALQSLQRESESAAQDPSAPSASASGRRERDTGKP